MPKNNSTERKAWRKERADKARAVQFDRKSHEKAEPDEQAASEYERYMNDRPMRPHSGTLSTSQRLLAAIFKN